MRGTYVDAEVALVFQMRWAPGRGGTEFAE